MRSTVRTPPFTPRQSPKRHQTGYASPELVEGAIGGLNAVVVAVATFPGFLLTVPGIVLVVFPLIVLGLAAAVAGLAVMLATLPLLVGWRLARRAGRSLSRPRVPRLPTITRRRQTTRSPAL